MFLRHRSSRTLSSLTFRVILSHNAKDLFGNDAHDQSLGGIIQVAKKKDAQLARPEHFQYIQSMFSKYFTVSQGS